MVVAFSVSISIYILTKHVVGTWDWSKGPKLRLRLPKYWPVRGVIYTGILFCSLMIGVGHGVSVYGCATVVNILLFGKHILVIFPIRSQ